MTAEKKGKQATKGAKQIVEENQSTLTFYRNMALGATVLFFIGISLISSFTWGTTVLFIFSLAVHIPSYQFMKYMARANYSETGQLLGSGVDLNMEGGVAEHVKDLFILTSGCQLLSIISNYFWLLWLLAPIRAFWIVWVNILSPWFFQQAPTNPEVDEKKQKKLERKMRKQR